MANRRIIEISWRAWIVLALIGCAHVHAAPMQMQDEGDPMSPATAPPTTSPGEAENEGDRGIDAPGMMDAPAPSPRSDDDQLLRGPDVPDSAARTLVRTDAQGRFQRIEGRPEEAALALLHLDPETREAAREAAAARRESLRGFLIENLNLIIASTDALEAGNQEEVRRIQQQMYERFDPEQVRDPVFDSIAAVISSTQQQELLRLTDEYWTALIDWELRNSKDKSEKARMRVQGRVAADLFQREFRLAYERTLRPIRNKFEAIVRAVEPTDEQKQEIRGILHEIIRSGGLEPSIELQHEAAARIYSILDEPRRKKLFEMAFIRM